MAAAYPRVCGATRLLIIDPSAAAGLSPRVRGNLSHAIKPAPAYGPIPACAGQP